MSMVIGSRIGITTIIGMVAVVELLVLEPVAVAGQPLEPVAVVERLLELGPEPEPAELEREQGLGLEPELELELGPELELAVVERLERELGPEHLALLKLSI
jgi:hypothetical protein